MDNREQEYILALLQDKDYEFLYENKDMKTFKDEMFFMLKKYYQYAIKKDSEI